MANKPIDYSVAGKWANHVRALAQIESGEDQLVHGDAGRAFGLLQMHPARFLEEAHRGGDFVIGVGDTWAQAQIKACAAYFDRLQLAPMPLIVQAWRLGCHAVFDEGARDATYYARWLIHFDRLNSE